MCFRLTGPLDKPIDVVKRLRACGLTLRAAHSLITRLASTRQAVCSLHEDSGLGDLARDLAGMNIQVLRRRDLDPSLIAEVRARHGLSQRAFADALGLDVDRLQNWEQGRNKPDAAVLALVTLFDTHPDMVQAATYGPVGDKDPT